MSIPEKPKSLIDEEVFELTLQKLRPKEPAEDIKKRAVARLRIFDNQQKVNRAFFPNLDHLAKQLHECDRIPRRSIQVNPEFKKELRASNQRLSMSKNGVPLYKILNQKSPRYSNIDPNERFSHVEELFKDNSSFLSPKSRQITLVQPVTGHPPERINLVERIHFSQDAQQKYQQMLLKQDHEHLQLRNEMISHLNHANERRTRAAEVFYNDMTANGVEIAQKNYNRASQMSRLRVMTPRPWWNDFITFAFQKNVGYCEEQFIKQIARNPNIKGSEFAKMKRTMQNKPKYKRCLELLEWINDKCKIIDETTLELLMADSYAHLNPRRSRRKAESARIAQKMMESDQNENISPNVE